MMYVITQEGVYRHAVRGVYDDLDLACKKAEEMIGHEEDNYHKYRVSSIFLNTPVNDINCVFEYSKDKNGILTKNKGEIF